MAEKRDGLSQDNFTVPSVYAPIFLEEDDGTPINRYILLASGRISGKTSILVAKWWITYNKYPDRDIVVCQATQTEIKDSIIVEIEKFLKNSGYQVGDNPTDTFYIPKSKDTVKWRNHKGTTYFFPITDSNGGQRARGIATPNPISLVMYEEVQKNKDRNVVDQSIFTFIRQLDKNAQMIVVGNNETVGHWFVDFTDEKKRDPDWLYIYACCNDIWELLNKQTQDYILSYKTNNPIEYRRIFLGDINASTSDVVFPQFKRCNNYKTKAQIASMGKKYISKLIIGIDHATANDKFAAVPVAILDDGTTQTLEVLVDDPKETNITLAPTEQCELLDNFLVWLDNEYGFTDNYVDTILSVDGASASFIAQLKHTKRTSENKKMWKRIQIRGFTKKKKYDVNLGIIKNAFAYGVLTILNEGTYTWDGSINKHRLAREIEAQRYKNGKLNPLIENDICDALEYGLIPYYTNCYNISFPVRLREARDAHYREVAGNIKGDKR